MRKTKTVETRRSPPLGTGAAARLLLCAHVGLLSGCGSLPDGHRWGHDATLAPGWQRLRTTVLRTASDPKTWAPAAGALLFRIGKADQSVSEWATEKAPIFRSSANAENSTHEIAQIALMAYESTVLLTPSGDDPFDWVADKAQGVAVGFSAMTLNVYTTSFLKDAVGRRRPNGGDRQSFPSSHASDVGVTTTLAERNIGCMPDVSETGTEVADVGLTALAALGCWGRVEAGVHYPSDVLAGYALGHFLGAVINDAFLGLTSQGVSLDLWPAENGCGVRLSFLF